ncbi:hypothetical protein KKB18_04170 [bacterium]|nr:hypothetical protein [bacterium]
MKSNIFLIGMILFCSFQYAFCTAGAYQVPSPFYYLSDVPIPDEYITTLAKAPDGTIWVGNETEAIATYKDGSWTVHFEDTNHADHQAIDFEFGLNNDVWVAVYNSSDQHDGFRHYSDNGWEYIEYTGEGAMTSVSSISLDKEGGLWFTASKIVVQEPSYYTRGLVLHFDGENWEQFLSPVWPDTSRTGPNGERLKDSICDSDGNLWFVAGDNGVSKYDMEKWTWYTSDQGGLANNFVEDVMIDKEGYLWFATSGGASRFDGISEWITYTTDDGLMSDEISKIYQYSRRNYWFLTGYGIEKFDGKKWTAYSAVEHFGNTGPTDLIEASDGDMWFAIFKTGISVLPYQADYPILNLSTDKGRYRAGDTITLSVEGENKGEDKHADIWLVMIDPAQNVYFALAWNNTPAPVISNIFFPAGFEMQKTTLSTFNVPNILPPISSAGTYIFAVGLADVGMTNFFHISTAQFEVVQ